MLGRAWMRWRANHRRKATIMSQVLDALSKANDVRSQRAKIKSDLAHQPSRQKAWRLAATYLADPHSSIHSMNVERFLGACYDTGPFQIGRLMKAAHARPSATVASLTDRERRELISYLMGHRSL